MPILESKWFSEMVYTLSTFYPLFHHIRSVVPVVGQ